MTTMGFRVDEFPDDPNLPAGTHDVFVRDAKIKQSKKTGEDMLLLTLESQETGQSVDMFFMLNKQQGWKIKKLCSVTGLKMDGEFEPRDFIDLRFRLQMTRSENGMANFVDATRSEGAPKRERPEGASGTDDLPF